MATDTTASVGSLRALAKELEISERRLTAWSKEAGFPRGEDGYDVGHVSAWILANHPDDVAETEPTAEIPSDAPQVEDEIQYVTIRLPIAKPKGVFANERLTRVNVTVRDANALKGMRAVHQGAFSSGAKLLTESKHVDNRSQLMRWLFEQVYDQLPNELR